jgi:hypothetical protein
MKTGPEPAGGLPSVFLRAVSAVELLADDEGESLVCVGAG